jgi:hypothetical protein
LILFLFLKRLFLKRLVEGLFSEKLVENGQAREAGDSSVPNYPITYRGSR